MELSAWVHEYVVGEDEAVIGTIASEFLKKSFTLLHLVESLGLHLTSTEKFTRGRGTKLLSEFLHRIDNSLLTNKEIRVLVNFFCDRVKDHHSITSHVLHGFLAISNMPEMSDDIILQIVQSIFKEVHCQSLAQADRRNVYAILNKFLNQNVMAIKGMGSEFVCSYVQMMDTEKDPRNLLICFDSVSIICKNIPLGPFAEDLFEVIACYFPIDFNPPENDPFGVTKEQLVTTLRKCLIASPAFAEFGLPLFIEKLTSSIPSAKIDALHTLSACASIYGYKSLKEYIGTLSFNICHEVFSANSQELESAALEAICVLSQEFLHDTASVGSIKGIAASLSYVYEIYKICERHLNEPGLKLMYPSAKCLWAAMSAVSSASKWILDKIVPLLLSVFVKHTDSSNRHAIIDIFLNFIKVAKKNFNEKQIFESLFQKKDEFFCTLISLLSDTNSSLRKLAVEGLVLCTEVNEFLLSEEICLISEHMKDLFLSDNDQSVRETCINQMKILSFIHPSVILDNILPKLFSLLKSYISSETTDCGHQVMPLGNLLNAVAVISSPPSLFQKTSLELASCVVDIKNEVRIHYLESLLQVISCSISDPANATLCINSIVPQLLEKMVSNAVENDAWWTQEKVVHLLTKIFRIIFEALPVKSNILLKSISMFARGDVAWLLSSHDIIFNPLDISSCSNQTQIISLLNVCLCYTDLSDCNAVDLPLLRKKVSSLALNSEHDFTALSAAKCYAVLINRCSDSEIKDEIQTFHTQLQNTILQSDRVIEFESSVQFWIWITKALILSGSMFKRDFIDKILDWLSHEKVAEKAANAFYIILNQYEDIFTPTMNCKIRLMYRQHFFMLTCGKIISGYNSCHTEYKIFFVTALAHLLKFIPKSVLSPELSKLLPLLVQSLSIDDVNLQISIVQTLSDLLESDSDILLPYVAEMIPKLLQLAKIQSMRVRCAALKCLGLIAKFDMLIISPHRSTVIKSLISCLDDHKLLVRREAVNTRTLWFLLETSK